ncbi:MAG TPA: hypothetical protein DIV86_01030 [Alphaproteobacteria bacterium]|nr:hypothetical protein [Alphaproteobacteria bacterium]
MKNNKLIKTFSIITLTILLGVVPIGSFASHPEGIAKTCKVETKVNGLVCDFCARSLDKIFKKQEAVEEIDVNLDDGLVSVFLKPQQDIEDKKIKQLITDAGYSVVSLDRKDCE